MISTIMPDTYTQLPVSPEQTVPGAPFPHKYVHCVFDDLQDAGQAVQTLRASDFDAREIHLMRGWDYMEAVEQRQTFLSFFSSGDYDGYLREAHRGSYILAVHPSSQEQMPWPNMFFHPLQATLTSSMTSRSSCSPPWPSR